MTLDLYSGVGFEEKTLLKTLNHIYKISKNEYQIDVNLNVNKISLRDSRLSFEINNLKNYEIQKIVIKAKNKFDVSNYEIIDNYDKCFLIRKK